MFNKLGGRGGDTYFFIRETIPLIEAKAKIKNTKPTRHNNVAIATPNRCSDCGMSRFLPLVIPSTILAIPNNSVNALIPIDTEVVSMLTNGEPMYNLLANSVLALVIFPVHAILEKLLKKRIVKS